MEHIDLLRILGLGVIGLGFLLALMAYRLLSNEQKKNEPNQNILKSITVFMIFSIMLSIIGLSSELVRHYLSFGRGGIDQTSDEVNDPDLFIKVKLTDESIKTDDFGDVEDIEVVKSSDDRKICIVGYSPNFRPGKKYTYKWGLYNINEQLLDTYRRDFIPLQPSWKFWNCKDSFTEYPPGAYYFLLSVSGHSKRKPFRVIE